MAAAGAPPPAGMLSNINDDPCEKNVYLYVAEIVTGAEVPYAPLQTKLKRLWGPKPRAAVADTAEEVTLVVGACAKIVHAFTVFEVTVTETADPNVSQVGEAAVKAS